MEYLKHRLSRGFSLTSGNQSKDWTLQEDLLAKESDVYKRNIQLAWLNTKRPGIPNEEKVNLIKKIGNLAWTGGPPASRFASEYLPRILELLDDPHTTEVTAIILIKAIVEICWFIDVKKDLIQRILTRLYSCIEEQAEVSTEQQRWAVYAMLCFASKHFDHQVEILKLPSLSANLHSMSQEVWLGWNFNEALKLSELLGINHQNEASSNEDLASLASEF